MTLDDENAAGTVNISIDISALTAADVMIGMYLNSDPAQGPAGMTLTHTSARASAGISSGIDCCKPDGHGDHDVQIEFPRAAAGRFTGDEAYTGMLMLDAVLATDFAFLSSTGSCAIERVQGLGSSAAGRGAVGSIARMSLSRKSRSRVRWPCPVSASACSACLVAAAKMVHQQ